MVQGKAKQDRQIEEVKLSKCPSCGCGEISLCRDREIEEHVQEDILLPKTETTLYRKHRYYCRGCGKTVTGRGKGGEVAKGRIGPLAKALAVFFKRGQ
ncbi:MAG: hypothetical protein WCV56_08910 [Candidatus Omnitrophota bacterium]